MRSTWIPWVPSTQKETLWRPWRQILGGSIYASLKTSVISSCRCLRRRALMRRSRLSASAWTDGIWAKLSRGSMKFGYVVILICVWCGFSCVFVRPPSPGMHSFELSGPSHLAVNIDEPFWHSAYLTSDRPTSSIYCSCRWIGNILIRDIK